MAEGFGLNIELVDCRHPADQCSVFGVEGSLVVNVPQQVGPAPLLSVIVMVAGGIEIADQHAGERIAQRLVHDCFAPTPPQEVALGGGAESPEVTVVPILTPAGFVGLVLPAWTTGLARMRSRIAAIAGWARCAVR